MSDVQEAPPRTTKEELEQSIKEYAKISLGVIGLKEQKEHIANELKLAEHAKDIKFDWVKEAYDKHVEYVGVEEPLSIIIHNKVFVLGYNHSDEGGDFEITPMETLIIED